MVILKTTCLQESDHKLLLCNESASFKSLGKDQEETFFLLIMHIVCYKLWNQKFINQATKPDLGTFRKFTA